MSIIDTLRFVQGATSTKDLVPEMKHFVIKGGSIKAFNGTLAIHSPIEFDVDCAPLAVPLVQALRHCESVVSLGMTGAGRLRVKSGRFKAFIDCAEMETLTDHRPGGKIVEVDGDAILKAVTTLSPFVGNDASRLWVNGIMFRGHSAYATNNVCLVEYWIGNEIPFEANVPMAAIKEIVRIGATPTHVQVDDHSLTFHYADQRWIRTQLYSTDWPDLSEVLGAPCTPEPIPPQLFEGLETLKPFLGNQALIHMRNGLLHTEMTDDLGATYEVDNLPAKGTYKHAMLSLLKGAATRADFSTYPKPCLFFGDRLRGAIVGLVV